jgi:hypothetical protein
MQNYRSEVSEACLCHSFFYLEREGGKMSRRKKMSVLELFSYVGLKLETVEHVLQNKRNPEINS